MPNSNLSNTLQAAASMIVKISTHELEILERHELNSSSYSAVLNQANNRILFGTEKCVHHHVDPCPLIFVY